MLEMSNFARYSFMRIIIITNIMILNITQKWTPQLQDKTKPKIDSSVNYANRGLDNYTCPCFNYNIVPKKNLQAGILQIISVECW